MPRLPDAEAAPTLSRPPLDSSDIDVLVVGGGGSGLAATVAAAQQGARVVVVERTARLGGTTARAVGSISAANTRLQRRAGIADTVASYRADMEKFIPTALDRDVPELRDMLVREAGATVDWLESVGVSFVGPFLEAPHTARRLHNAFPTAKAYVERLKQSAERLGVRTLTGTRLVGLKRNGAGWAAEFADDGRSFELTAPAVVLAAGDMSGNDELRRKWLSQAAVAALPINRDNTGDAHQLGMAIGAATRNLSLIYGPQLRFPAAPGIQLVDLLPNWAWFQKLGAFCFNVAPVWMVRPFVRPMMVTNLSPSSILFAEGAILLNRDGRRFCNEKTSLQELASQPGACGFIVMNEATARKFETKGNYISTVPGLTYAYLKDYRKGRKDLYYEAADAAALAAWTKLNAANVATAVADAWGLSPGRLVALGPVYSMLTVTEGGLAVDSTCRVLDEAGAPLTGLYAAGGTGGGLPLNGHGHHLAWAMTSGRVAGAAAARTAADATREHRV